MHPCVECRAGLLGVYIFPYSIFKSEYFDRMKLHIFYICLRRACKSIISKKLDKSDKNSLMSLFLINLNYRDIYQTQDSMLHISFKPIKRKLTYA